MRTLDRYIGINFLWGFFLVLVILASLFSFLEFVAELDEIGKGQYQLQDAALFVALTMPRRLLDLVPISTLLGSIVALGLLADKNELIAMRAVGLSVLRICWSVLATTLLLMLATGLLAEFVVPPMEQDGRMRRSQALSEPGILVTKQGFWARHGDSFVRVGGSLRGETAVDIDIYVRDPDGRLRIFTHAREADITDDKRWVLRDIEQKIVGEQGITTRHLPSLTLKSFLDSEQVNILELPPDSLSPSDLYQYVQTLRERGQNADRYILALWQKLALPLTTGAMVLLSLPFVFGPPRGTTAGRRIMMGAMAGLAFYLANQIIARLGLLLNLHPGLTTLAPVTAILLVAFWLIRRVP
ncbi:MAG: LPS export ABC transporter permease LptG [Deltaproteobacteria bacterium]|nr:MAG: LPS export ABC transporter permease LptG [Deltaproteobacteria bacterium]